MKSEGLLKEHEVRRRDLLILKYDKQRSLCDEIILRQQKLIEGRLGKGKKGRRVLRGLAVLTLYNDLLILKY